MRMEVEEYGSVLLNKSILERRIVDAAVAVVGGVGVIILGGGRGCGALLRGTKTSDDGIEIVLTSMSFPLGFLDAG